MGEVVSLRRARAQSRTHAYDGRPLTELDEFELEVEIIKRRMILASEDAAAGGK